MDYYQYKQKGTVATSGSSGGQRNIVAIIRLLENTGHLDDQWHNSTMILIIMTRVKSICVLQSVKLQPLRMCASALLCR